MSKVSKVRKPNIVRGGIAIPLGRNYYYMSGRKHETGGIDIGKNPHTGLEVEDGEVMHIGDKHVEVFSAQPFLNGKSPAQRVMDGENPTKVFNAQESYKDRNKINDDGTKKKRMGGLSRDKDYRSKSKPYPNVKKSDFAGGGRSYPIPTKADARDALRLAGLHHRPDVKAKAYRKYPDLRKKAKAGGLYSVTINGETKLYQYPSTGKMELFKTAKTAGRVEMKYGGRRKAPIGTGAYYVNEGNAIPTRRVNERKRQMYYGRDTQHPLTTIVSILDAKTSSKKVNPNLVTGVAPNIGFRGAGFNFSRNAVKTTASKVATTNNMRGAVRRVNVRRTAKTTERFNQEGAIGKNTENALTRDRINRMTGRNNPDDGLWNKGDVPEGSLNFKPTVRERVSNARKAIRNKVAAAKRRYEISKANSANRTQSTSSQRTSATEEPVNNTTQTNSARTNTTNGTTGYRPFRVSNWDIYAPDRYLLYDVGIGTGIGTAIGVGINHLIDNSNNNSNSTKSLNPTVKNNIKQVNTKQVNTKQNNTNSNNNTNNNVKYPFTKTINIGSNMTAPTGNVNNINLGLTTTRNMINNIRKPNVVRRTNTSNSNNSSTTQNTNTVTNTPAIVNNSDNVNNSNSFTFWEDEAKREQEYYDNTNPNSRFPFIPWQRTSKTEQNTEQNTVQNNNANIISSNVPRAFARRNRDITDAKKLETAYQKASGTYLNWFQRTYKNVKNYVNKHPDTVNEGIGLASNVISSFIGNSMNRRMLNSLRYSSAPIPQRAAKLKTRININPQLDRMRESLASYERAVDANTASSAVALARKQRARIANTLSTNELYGDKENRETVLINQDRLNQQEVANRNIDAYNAWAQGKTDFENNIRMQKAENNIALMNNLNAGVQNVINNIQQRRTEGRNIRAMLLAYPDLPVEQLLASGIITQEEYDSYRKAYPLKRKTETNNNDNNK